MSYSTNPVHDAERYMEQIARDAQRVQAAEAHFRDMIVSTLTKSIRTVPHQTLALPRIKIDSGITSIGSEPLREVVSDECSYGVPLDALMNVLAKSDCIYVAQLRQVIADRYCDANVAWLAEESL